MSSPTKGHTPLPWRLGTDGNVWSGETGGEQLAVVHHLGGEDSVKGQNGRLVVRAVNLHERLLAVCRALDDMDFCEGYTFPDGDWPKLWAALGLARAAIRDIAEAAP